MFFNLGNLVSKSYLFIKFIEVKYLTRLKVEYPSERYKPMRVEN